MGGTGGTRPRAASAGGARPRAHGRVCGLHDCNNPSVQQFLTDMRVLALKLHPGEQLPPGEPPKLLLEHILIAMRFAMQYDVQAHLPPQQRAASRALYSSLLGLEGAGSLFLAMFDDALRATPAAPSLDGEGLPGLATVAFFQVRVGETEGVGGRGGGGGGALIFI